MKLTILVYPDDKLREKALDVDVVTQSAEIIELVTNLVETMRAAEGMGLAATQVGVALKVFVLDLGDGIKTFINPEIISYKGETISEEGCLSFPDDRRKTMRARKIKVKHQGLDGNWYVEKAEGLYAVAIQHEYDHLMGKLFIDLPAVK